MKNINEYRSTKTFCLTSCVLRDFPKISALLENKNIVAIAHDAKTQGVGCEYTVRYFGIVDGREALVDARIDTIGKTARIIEKQVIQYS